LHILRKLTNNSNATWKSPLQWQAIKQVLKMSNDILLIMATGGGKTMVAIIPTLMDGNVSVIVLPLNSLITDYKRKFDAMGIKYDHYTSSTRTLRQDVHFILVSADMAMTASWKQCILDLNDHVEVTRLFFDEAHLPLLNRNFRAALSHLSDLRLFSMQFILLTGTAPPSSVKELYKIFGLISSKTSPYVVILIVLSFTMRYTQMLLLMIKPSIMSRKYWKNIRQLKSQGMLYFYLFPILTLGNCKGTLTRTSLRAPTPTP
jgi:superfamily II DNA helicase RecQ